MECGEGVPPLQKFFLLLALKMVSFGVYSESYFYS